MPINLWRPDSLGFWSVHVAHSWDKPMAQAYKWKKHRVCKFPWSMGRRGVKNLIVCMSISYQFLCICLWDSLGNDGNYSYRWLLECLHGWSKSTGSSTSRVCFHGKSISKEHKRICELLAKVTKLHGCLCALFHRIDKRHNTVSFFALISLQSW